MAEIINQYELMMRIPWRKTCGLKESGNVRALKQKNMSSTGISMRRLMEISSGSRSSSGSVPAII